jgi:hypothetical protein
LKAQDGKLIMARNKTVVRGLGSPIDEVADMPGMKIANPPIFATVL